MTLPIRFARRVRNSGAVASLLLVSGLMAGAATGAIAQDAPPIDGAAVERGLEVFRQSGCRACHGWSANGVREGENPQGPSIRETQLPAEAIRVTIQCGRPTTLMPYFDHQAYNFDERCYGISRFNVGELQLPPKGRISLTEPQLDDIVAYLIARVIGLPNAPTLAQCELFFGADSNSCNIYR